MMVSDFKVFQPVKRRRKLLALSFRRRCSRLELELNGKFSGVAFDNFMSLVHEGRTRSGKKLGGLFEALLQV